MTELNIELSIVSTEDYISLNQTNTSYSSRFLILLDNKLIIDNLVPGDTLSNILGISSSNEIDIVKASAGCLSQHKDTGSSVELLLIRDTSTIPSRVLIHLLPSNFSRHNAPSRSHAVTSIVNNAHGGDNMTIILAPSSKDYIRPRACAISRCFPLYSHKTTKPKNFAQKINVVIIYPDTNLTEDVLELRNINFLSQSIRLCQRLVDAPPNELTSVELVKECNNIQSNLGCLIRVIKGAELEEQGLGGIFGVGKASIHPPALVILSYVPGQIPHEEQKKSICLVGKGIIYDTGGLSLKSGTGMVGMKRDMAGSAAVLGAFVAIVKSGISRDTPVHALLCIAENCIGPTATRPDDIHTLYSGKTVEINNTDAEGRLVLADGCAYSARNLNPQVIIDIATLTGAQAVATGKKHAAIFCSEEELEILTVRVGKESGDLTYPILYCPEFHKPEFSSKVADMKNSASDKNNAGASCAAQFIGNHIEDFLSASTGGKWLHIDMAGPGHTAERATGYGVALLYGLVEALAAA